MKALITGASSGIGLDMAKYLCDKDKKLWLRHVLVPGVTDSDDELKKIKAFSQGLTNVEKLEILPYHTLGVSKWEKLGIDYPLIGVPTPTKEEITKAEKLLGIFRD